MSRLCILTVCALLLFCSSAIYAAPVGNPAEPALLEKEYPIKISGTAGNIFRRDLDKGEAKIDETREYVGKLAFNVKGKVEIYGLLGGVESAEYRKDSNIISGSSTDTDLDPALLYGGGASAVIFEKPLWDGELIIGLDGKYQRFEADIGTIAQDNAEQAFTGDSVESQEWQVALGLSYLYGPFVPYCGIKYSDVRIEEEVTISSTKYTSKLSSDKVLGGFAGCDFIFNDSAKISVEGRFIDEMALSVGGTFRF